MKYLAIYNIRANEFSLGGNRPYEREESHRFEADDDISARESALSQIYNIARELIGVERVNLKSLERVKEVSVSS